MSKKEISTERKTLYYVGMGLMIIGLLLFLSTFLLFINPDRIFRGSVRVGSVMLRPFIGMIMVAVGGGMRSVAAKGVAGSGIILDPKRAREDLSPWSTMAGGMLEDALEDTSLGKGKETQKEVIKIRCKNCSALNDEDSRFCKSCGNPI